MKVINCKNYFTAIMLSIIIFSTIEKSNNSNIKLENNKNSKFKKQISKHTAMMRKLPPMYNYSVHFPRNKFVTALTLPSQYPDEDLFEKKNCNEVCQYKHSKLICNLGIVSGEAKEPENISYLTCACISNNLMRGQGTQVNIHTHADWCFNVFGCYKSLHGKCNEIKKQ